MPRKRERYFWHWYQHYQRGKAYLGAAIGNRPYTKEYVVGKVLKWSEDIEQLVASIAQTQPPAAYCAYTHGLSSCWTFLSQTIPNIAGLLQLYSWSL